MFSWLPFGGGGGGGRGGGLSLGPSDSSDPLCLLMRDHLKRLKKTMINNIRHPMPWIHLSVDPLLNVRDFSWYLIASDFARWSKSTERNHDVFTKITGVDPPPLYGLFDNPDNRPIYSPSGIGSMAQRILYYVLEYRMTMQDALLTILQEESLEYDEQVAAHDLWTCTTRGYPAYISTHREYATRIRDSHTHTVLENRAACEQAAIEVTKGLSIPASKNPVVGDLAKMVINSNLSVNGFPTYDTVINMGTPRSVDPNPQRAASFSGDDGLTAKDVLNDNEVLKKRGIFRVFNTQSSFMGPQIQVADAMCEPTYRFLLSAIQHKYALTPLQRMQAQRMQAELSTRSMRDVSMRIQQNRVYAHVWLKSGSHVETRAIEQLKQEHPKNPNLVQDILALRQSMRSAILAFSGSETCNTLLFQIDGDTNTDDSMYLAHRREECQNDLFFCTNVDIPEPELNRISKLTVTTGGSYSPVPAVRFVIAELYKYTAELIRARTKGRLDEPVSTPIPESFVPFVYPNSIARVTTTRGGTKDNTPLQLTWNLGTRCIVIESRGDQDSADTFVVSSTIRGAAALLGTPKSAIVIDLNISKEMGIVYSNKLGTASPWSSSISPFVPPPFPSSSPPPQQHHLDDVDIFGSPSHRKNVTAATQAVSGATTTLHSRASAMQSGGETPTDTDFVTQGDPYGDSILDHVPTTTTTTTATQGGGGDPNIHASYFRFVITPGNNGDDDDTPSLLNTLGAFDNRSMSQASPRDRTLTALAEDDEGGDN